MAKGRVTIMNTQNSSDIPAPLHQMPRPEYPRPQMQRRGWQNLNGLWRFAFDPGNSGKDRRMYEHAYAGADFTEKILVPFCPESRLSGIGKTDFVQAVWYKREILLSKDVFAGRILLHFGAVDYHCEVWINGQACGSHDGGYSSFCFDITDQAQAGTNQLTVYAFDDLRSGTQPAGKQSPRYASYGCSYTRTTGIWQTVWLEFVPQVHIGRLHMDADYLNTRVSVTVTSVGLTAVGLAPDGVAATSTAGHSWSLTARLLDLADSPCPDNPEGWPTAELTVLASAEAMLVSGPVSLMLEPEDRSVIQPWGPGQANLYGFILELVDAAGCVVDEVRSYVGFRTLELLPDGLHLNGKPVFQRLILDQGFYPEGVYTAPSDDDLRLDIVRSLDLGFNGARLHEKVFEARFLYWADRLGYLVWGEQANWCMDISTADGLIRFLPEWLEVVARDRNHPSIIGWCPLNETWDQDGKRQLNDVLRLVYLATKAADPSRPVIDTSGNFHVVTDIFDVHDYEQDPAVFAGRFLEMKNGGPIYNTYPGRQKYGGQPYMVSEYGGTWWSPGHDDGWGYGVSPADESEFRNRYEGLTRVLLENPRICGFCYTQLTDVEQEQNGLYTYTRLHKFSPETYALIRAVNSTESAYEKASIPTTPGCR